MTPSKATLLWQLANSSNVAFFEEIEEATGKTPEPLLNAPHLPPHLAPYLEAFWMLSPGRQLGFGLGGIATADLWAYWQAQPLGEPLRFFAVVRALDSAYIEHTNEQQAKRTPP